MLRLERRAVTIDPLTEYSLIGVYSFGKGIFHREPRPGGELGDYRFFAVEPGDLVLSNIQAWEAAIALARPDDAGTIGTHRFLTYVPRDNRIDTSWARWFFLSEPGMVLIRQAAPGTVTRNRTLAMDRFEALEIPLPPVEQQRQVAAELERVAEAHSRTSERLQRARVVAAALADSQESQLLERLSRQGVPLRPLGEVADVGPRPSRLPSDQAVAFVPMAAVSAKLGEVVGGDIRAAGEVGSGYRQFRRGDVIFARITPCMQNGKSAIFREPEFGYGSTEFHVLRPGLLSRRFR